MPHESMAADPVEWNPLTPDVGETVTITYDPAATDATIPSSAGQVYLVWGMYVRGNQFLAGKDFGVVPPSMEIWPTDTEVYVLTSYRFVKTPMTDLGGIWTISLEMNDKPEYLVIYFEDETATRDNKNGNYWFINSLLKDERISVVQPTFAQPLIALNASPIDIQLKAPASASDWHVTLNGVGNPIEPIVSSSFNPTYGIWELGFTAPSQIGLFDVNISATINGRERYDWEPNSLKLIEEFKSEYKFVVFSDPQFHRDGSAGYAYRNEETGKGNFTDVLREVNLLNPEFILVAGDLTEWTDEIALLNFRKWCDLYLDNTPVVLIMGNHGDFEGTASTGVYEWGSGKGMWLTIMGSPSGIFYYGSHAVVRGDSHSLQFNDVKDDGVANYNFVMDALDTVASEDMKFLMLHHPLSTYGKPSEEIIQGDIELNAIISKLQAIGASAHFHGHTHLDKYDKTGDLHHIGTAEAVGDNPSFRVVNIANNEMINFSYVNPNASVYYAPSNPIGGLESYFMHDNDGSQANQAVAIRNCYSQSYNDAHIRFYMQDGPTYNISGGTLHNSFVQDGKLVLDVQYTIAAESNHIVSVSSSFMEISISVPICPPITVEPPPDPTPSTTTTTTTTASATAFLLVELLLFIAAIPVLRRRRK
ncbi:MAG: metallophosphoesterase family protein [Candidatus Hodarchaeales archaeon]